MVEATVPPAQLERQAARLAGQISSLQIELAQLGARLSQLEQGLLLGTLPKELRERSLHGPILPAKSDLTPTKVPLASPPAGLTQPDDREGPAEHGPSHGDHPDAKGPNEDAASLDAAEKAWDQGHFSQALVLYQRALQTVPGQQGGHALYWVARCLHRLQAHADARRCFLDFLAQFETSPLAPGARFYLADVEIALGMSQLARGRLVGLIQEAMVPEALLALCRERLERLDMSL